MFESTDHTFAVCAYGESPYLESCIKSLLSQSVSSNVLISTSTPNDYIFGIARQYEVPVYINEGEPGISRDWNCALARCSTPLATIAHQDDIYLPDYTSSILQAINEEKRPLIAFTDYGEIRGNDRILNESKLLRVKRMMLAPLTFKRFRSIRFIRRCILSVGSPICCPSVTFCLPNLPSPQFLYGMKCDLDWDAWERYSKLNGSFIYIPSILMRHRIHPESETSVLIENSTRTLEDISMLRRFWPTFIAEFINHFYSKSQCSNYDDCDLI